MKTGWLVVNHFLRTDKFTELYNLFIKSAEHRGVNLVLKTNAELISLKNKPLPEFVLFWDKDVFLAKQLENAGIRVFNSSESIFLCDNKLNTYFKLQNSGIKMPKHVLAPLSFAPYDDFSFLTEAESILSYPFIIKECVGSFGNEVYLAKNTDEAKSIIKNIGGRPFFFQEFIKSSFGRDVRLQVVGDKVICAMLRINETGDFRANASNGAKTQAYTPTEAQKELAVRACRKLGLCFGGVDLLFGEKKEPVLCEVNSNAHFKNLYNCTGVNTADYIIEEICK